MAAPEGGRALPLLSGIAPRTEAASNAPRCHRCNREFGLLTRRKYCNHCGYAYCGHCCDHQAMCPRTDTTGYRPGYENVLVCTYCIEMLSITASGKTQLRGMSVQRLRTYLDAYGIKPKSVLEKDDLIEAILDARGLNGCLSSDNEKFYRSYTIARRSPPDTRQRGANSSSSGRSSGPIPPQRPRSTDPRVNAGNRPTVQPSRPPPMPNRSSDSHSQNPQYHRPTSPRQEQPAPAWSPPRSPPPLRFPAPHHAPNVYPRPNSPPPQPRWQTRPQSPTTEYQQDNLRPPTVGRSRSRSVPSSETPNTNINRPPQPPPPPSSPRPRAPQSVPLLATIVGMTREDLALYNVATLKGILQANHVNARLILEKSELIDKVITLIETEKRERAREQAIHEAEERALREQQRLRQEQLRAEAERRVQETASQNVHPARARSPPPDRSTSPRPSPNVATGYVERDGLCVVCQDEEANVAIVDCGHLALCMGCSDTIMKSTKECPLCRTRIVTEQRLLRIFKS